MKSKKEEGVVARFKSYRDSHHLKPVIALILYMAIPLTAFQLIMARYPYLDPTRFETATMYVLVIATAIIIVTLIQEMYKKGTVPRLGLDVVYVMLTLLWLLSIIGGSTRIYSKYDGHPFYVDVTPVVMIIGIVAAFTILYDVLEYIYYMPEKPETVKASKTPAFTSTLATKSIPAHQGNYSYDTGSTSLEVHYHIKGIEYGIQEKYSL